MVFLQNKRAAKAIITEERNTLKSALQHALHLIKHTFEVYLEVDSGCD